MSFCSSYWSVALEASQSSLSSSLPSVFAFVLGGKDVLSGDSAVRRRERCVAVVERRGAFVVDDAPRVELGLTRLLAVREFLNACIDRFDARRMPLWTRLAVRSVSSRDSSYRASSALLLLVTQSSS